MVLILITFRHNAISEFILLKQCFRFFCFFYNHNNTQFTVKKHGTPPAFIIEVLQRLCAKSVE